MNYPVPVPPGAYTGTSVFFVNSTFQLGAITKPVNAKNLVTVDYTSLSLPSLGIITFWFEVDIGSAPPLIINNAMIAIGGNQLEFVVSQGVPGVTYTISVNITYGTSLTRTDKLVVSVPAEECGCTGGSGNPVFPISNLGGFVNGDNTVFISTFLRYFVSSQAPLGANIFDQWWNTTNGVLSEYVTDGLNLFWEPIAPLPPANAMQTDLLPIGGVNSFPPLSQIPNGGMIQVTVDGRPFNSPEAFTYSGKQITWTSTLFSVPVGATVYVTYSYTP